MRTKPNYYNQKNMKVYGPIFKKDEEFSYTVGPHKRTNTIHFKFGIYVREDGALLWTRGDPFQYGEYRLNRFIVKLKKIPKCVPDGIIFSGILGRLEMKRVKTEHGYEVHVLIHDRVNYRINGWSENNVIKKIVLLNTFEYAMIRRNRDRTLEKIKEANNAENKTTEMV